MMNTHKFYGFLLLAALCGMAFVGCEKEDTLGERDNMDGERRVSTLPVPQNNQIYYSSTCKLDIQFFESAVQHDYDSVSGRGCVTFSEAIDEIPAQAFEGDDSITAVALPSSVTTIGSRAFDGCASLYSATMLEVRTIGDRAFSNCQLTSIDLPYVETIGDYAFYKCKIEIVSLFEVRTVGSSAFESCPVASVALGAKTEYLGNNAFGSSTYYQGISNVVSLKATPPQCGGNPFAGSRPFLFVRSGCGNNYKAWLGDGWVYLISPYIPPYYCK